MVNIIIINIKKEMKLDKIDEKRQEKSDADLDL